MLKIIKSKIKQLIKLINRKFFFQSSKELVNQNSKSNIEEDSMNKHKSSAEYWTNYMVQTEDFANSTESLEFFHWRNAQYPNYINLMPVTDQDGKVVVEYGCGPGNDLVGFSVYSNPKRLIGIDVSKTALEASNKRLALHNRKIELIQINENDNRIPLESESVDFVHTSGVLHHCKNIDKVLIELNRILKQSGEMQVMVYNYNSLWVHLYTAYINQIQLGLYSDLDIMEAFKHTTDGPDCPISKCYKPNEFVDFVMNFGFKGDYIDSSISLTEMIYLQKRFDALQERKLPAEHREFLTNLTFDNKGIPIYKGQVAGINACYKFTKS